MKIHSNGAQKFETVQNCFELSLDLLVEDTMEDTSNATCVLYSFDSSDINGIGNYVVQSLTIVPGDHLQNVVY